MYDLLLTNASVATMDGEEPFGLVAHAAIGIADGKIAWIGPSATARRDQAGEVRDLGGRVVTPGLVDPHTHIVYGEEGLDDFEVLSQGGGRWDLEPAGAGIWAMAKRTRALSEEALYAASRRRMSRLAANGVTTVESKSGAGLDRDTELRQMRVSRALGEDLPVTVVSSYLGAHGLPPEEFGGRRDDYVTFMCEEVLPEAARQGIVDHVDGFCDQNGYSHAQIGRLFDRAQSFGLPVKLHADQYTDFGGRCGRREAPRALRRPPRVRLAGDGRGDGGGGHRRHPPSRRAPHLPRDPQAARRPVPRARGADGPRDQLQPGELAHRLSVVPDAPRVLPLPADPGGGAARLHRERRPRARALGPGGPDRGRPGRGPRGLGYGRPARNRLPDRGLRLRRGHQGRGCRPRAGGAGNRGMTAARERLLGWIEGERDRQVEFLQSLTRIDTCNPPGDTRAAAGLVSRFLSAEGIAGRTEAPRPEMPNLVSSFGGSGDGRHLVLNGHLDVFPIGDRSAWTRDPLSGEVVDGRVHGRGTVDMNCGTTALVFTHAYLNRLRSELPGRVTLTVVSDEETGGRWGSGWLTENCGDEVLGDCVLNAEPSGLGTIRFGEKSMLWLRFVIRTAGGHSAYPHTGASANRIAAHLVRELEAIESMAPAEPDTVAATLDRPDVRAAIESSLGKGASGVMRRVSANVGTVHGGVAINMLPAECVLDVDFRLPGRHLAGAGQAGRSTSIVERLPRSPVRGARHGRHRGQLVGARP